MLEIPATIHICAISIFWKTFGSIWKCLFYVTTFWSSFSWRWESERCGLRAPLFFGRTSTSSSSHQYYFATFFIFVAFQYFSLRSRSNSIEPWTFRIYFRVLTTRNLGRRTMTVSLIVVWTISIFSMLTILTNYFSDRNFSNNSPGSQHLQVIIVRTLQPFVTARVVARKIEYSRFEYFGNGKFVDCCICAIHHLPYRRTPNYFSYRNFSDTTPGSQHRQVIIVRTLRSFVTARVVARIIE